MNDENGVKHCASCGVEINYNGLYCNNCIESKEMERNNKIAKISTMLFIICYIIFFFLFNSLSNLGERLSGDTSNELPMYVSLARILAPCFFFSIIPFCLSLVFSKKAKMNSLFKFDIIVLIIHVILSFV